jgi:HAE1 family hydrophobic/amphiphilic exporter-1
MSPLRHAVEHPVTVVVGVLLLVLAGFVALRRIPVQLTPSVEDTIVAVTTSWEGASPEEIEQEVVDAQEDKLQGISNLRAMTSTSLQGVGTIRLEFQVGTKKEVALREVSDKLREVPSYPVGVDEPVIEASDPDNRDYIAWIVLSCGDPTLDVRTLQTFAEDRIKPVLERVAGVSEINVLGGREREVQVRFDPRLLAQRGIGVSELAEALRRANRNVSGGAVAEDKADVRLRMVNQFQSVAQVEETLIASTGGGPIFVRDVAEVVEDFKEATSLVHSRGQPCIAINAQKEVGANVMTVMAGLHEAVARLNRPGELLESQGRAMGLAGGLELELVYDQTVYIDDALQLVKDNIWLGGALAVAVLLVYLRSVRAAGVIALSIPISILGAIAAMVGMGRTINVISLAGMAFAVGMVVDNAIVVLENIHRHVELGKSRARAALEGSREVWGAVLASTLTTLVVFVPILLIQDEAGQLFRDISLAIVAAIAFSMIVALTVVPCCAARVLPERTAGRGRASGPLRGLLAVLDAFPALVGRTVRRLTGSTSACALVALVLTAASVLGTYWLLPPADYLPAGNRNLAFGLLIPPPGYSLDQQATLARRVEEVVRPFWEAGAHARGSEEYERAKAALPSVPTFDMRRMQPGPPVVPPPLENYFIVSFRGAMFHGGISREPDRVVDMLPLFQHATRAEIAPGVLAFAFQVPLFQLGGATGSAVKINFAGDDLDQVAGSALAVYQDMIGRYGVFAVQPDPSNFNIPNPELSVRPKLVRLGDVGLSPSELGQTVQALGDGLIVGDYRVGGTSFDLKLVAASDGLSSGLGLLGHTPLATPRGGVVPLSSVGELVRTNVAAQINREGRRRAVTLQFTPPPGLPLESAVESAESILAEHRARGTLPPAVATSTTGSASKLAAVRAAMLGDGSLAGALSSALVLALLVVYLVMCVLFQSFLSPLIIMYSVPLATLGGFAALRGVHAWSLADPYMPVQNLDVLTMLGFVILIGVVVNNAILIVHQTENFLRGGVDEAGASAERLSLREAIAEAVRTRVRPIFMSTLTSVGGLAPLVFMPGSGSELYRGLGAVVLGGLLCSTVFTLVLVPALLALFYRKPRARRGAPAGAPAALALLLVCLAASGLLASCGSPRERDARAARTQAREALSDAVASAQGEPARGEWAALPRAAGAFADRLDELEALGGAAALRRIQPPPPARLLAGQPGIEPVDLGQALASAIEHNLGLQLARVAPSIEATSVEAARAEFDPVLFSELRIEAVEEPQVVPVIGSVVLGSDASQADHQWLEAGWKQRLAGGATLQASALLDRNDDQTSGIDFSPDPAARSRIALSLTQPLLRGAGDAVNRVQIDLARNQERRALCQLEAEVLEVVAAVELAYWDLAEAWQRLEIQEQLSASGEEVERVLASRQAFDAAPAEYADALATVEERRTQRVREQRAVSAACDRLKLLMNHPHWTSGGEILLRPSAAWDARPLDLDLGQAVARALEQRPELRAVWLAIDDAGLRERLARSAERVRLDLSGGIVLAGLDEEFGDALGEVGEGEFPSAYVGLALELPVGNRAARAARERARLEARAAVLRHERAAQEILVQVKSALRELQAAGELVSATRSARIARSENLRALSLEEERRSALTPEFLALKFQRQESLAQSQRAELSALADLARARARLERALGASPGARLAPGEWD